MVCGVYTGTIYQVQSKTIISVSTKLPVYPVYVASTNALQYSTNDQITGHVPVPPSTVYAQITWYGQVPQYLTAKVVGLPPKSLCFRELPQSAEYQLLTVNLRKNR